LDGKENPKIKILYIFFSYKKAYTILSSAREIKVCGKDSLKKPNIKLGNLT
jgi:hypothetical protein